MNTLSTISSEKSLYNSTAKRLCLKNLVSSINPNKISQKIDQSFSILQKAVEAVFYDKSFSETLEELYNSVECICSHNLINRLHEMLHRLFNSFVDEILSGFNKNSISLSFVSSTWDIYSKKMLKIRNIFLYLDRQLHSMNSDFETTWNLAVMIFREKIILNSNLHLTILNLLLNEIKNERNGQTIQTLQVRSIIRMYIDLQVYERLFQPEFLSQTQQMYATEAATLLQTYSVSDYLNHTQKRIQEEEKRLNSYLNSSITSGPLMKTLDNEFLVKAVDQILEKSYVKLIQSDEEDRDVVLSLLYRLLMRIASNGIEKLKKYFKEDAKKTIKSIVMNPTNDPKRDKYMIESLLRKRQEYLSIIKNCFDDEITFKKVFSESIEEGINSRPNKPAEYLAKHIDSNLKSGNKLKNNEEFDQVIENSMVLFQFIDGKDVFEAFYSKELAKRLLLGKSASVDAEKLMLTKLKEECGANYTRNLEVMFQDIELSRQLSKNFRSYLQSVIENKPSSEITPATEEEMAVDGESQLKEIVIDESVPLTMSIELNVNVITPSAWPPYAKATAIYPPEMIRLRNEFTKFYLSHHRSRRLCYDPTLGSCIVKADLHSCGRKELQVSEYQALVLLTFNQETDKPLTFAEIQTTTGIEENELKRALLSLAANKDQKILLKKPVTVEVKPDHEFSLNKAFTHKLTRIKFNQVQLKETKEEQKETEERVFSDRIVNVDCCIVRIMKTRKTIEHNALMTEVYSQLNFPLKAADVKKRIENLIDRDYIKRDPDNNAVYQYVS